MTTTQAVAMAVVAMLVRTRVAAPISRAQVLTAAVVTAVAPAKETVLVTSCKF